MKPNELEPKFKVGQVVDFLGSDAVIVEVRGLESQGNFDDSAGYVRTYIITRMIGSNVDECKAWESDLKEVK